MKTKVRVGKKLTIHIPKAVAEELNIKDAAPLSWGGASLTSLREILI